MKKNYIATHKIYEHGAFEYLWDHVKSAVLTKSGDFYVKMYNGWGDEVLAGKKSHYKFEEIVIDLENK